MTIGFNIDFLFDTHKTLSAPNSTHQSFVIDKTSASKELAAVDYREIRDVKKRECSAVFRRSQLHQLFLRVCLGDIYIIDMASKPNQLQNLDIIEGDLVESLTAAGQALRELSKEKPNAKTVESFTNAFMTRLDHAGSELTHQIAYLTKVTTGQTSEGASFGHSGKDSKMAQRRLEHAKARLNGLQ